MCLDLSVAGFVTFLYEKTFRRNVTNPPARDIYNSLSSHKAALERYGQCCLVGNSCTLYMDDTMFVNHLWAFTVSVRGHMHLWIECPSG